MSIKTIEEADFNKKKVLARFDFNVPLKEGKITDTTRVDLALPTIQFILKQNPACLILVSHLGRPKGQVNSKYSLEPVAEYLAEKLEQEVTLTESATDSSIKQLIGFNKSKILLLENIRFDARETEGDQELAKILASYADLYVNDAFGAAHRKHASTYTINAFFKNKNYAGFLIKKELEALDKIVGQPKKPFKAIIGGAKVSDKIKTLERLLPVVDQLLIGGAMAYPFLKAKDIPVGKSLCSDEDVKLAAQLIKQDRGGKILLPCDHAVADSPEGDPLVSQEQSITENLMGLDIGPQTIQKYAAALAQAQTIFWNGPMGLFENTNFAKGTFAIAEALAKSSAFTLVGGGDSVSAVKKSGCADKISHISTGGGASLEYIEKGSLPGIQALQYGVEL